MDKEVEKIVTGDYGVIEFIPIENTNDYYQIVNGVKSFFPADATICQTPSKPGWGGAANNAVTHFITQIPDNASYPQSDYHLMDLMCRIDVQNGTFFPPELATILEFAVEHGNRIDDSLMAILKQFGEPFKSLTE